MDEFAQYFKTHQDYKLNKIERDKDISKKKLYRTAETKIRTTMIGALSSIENNLKKFWDVPNPTAEQIAMKETFEECVRSEILDRGNNQIRNLENEFGNYEILYKKKIVYLPLWTGDSNEGR